MSRSIAQQLEHWAQLGAALEAAGVTLGQVRSMLGGDLRARERVAMKLGWATQESMYLIPPAMARAAKLTMPDVSALDAQ